MVRSMSLSKWGPSDFKLQASKSEEDHLRTALCNLSEENNTKFEVLSANFDSHHPLQINSALRQRCGFLCSNLWGPKRARSVSRFSYISATFR